MSHQRAQLVATGGRKDASCGSAFFACATLYSGTTSIEICISVSACPSGSYGIWNFTGNVVTYPKGKKYSKIKVSFSPNPGNPTYNIFKVKKIKNTHGKVRWAENITACEVTNPSKCLTGAVGLIGR
jgi:hypothetical protein